MRNAIIGIVGIVLLGAVGLFMAHRPQHQTLLKERIELAKVIYECQRNLAPLEAIPNDEGVDEQLSRDVDRARRKLSIAKEKLQKFDEEHVGIAQELGYKVGEWR